MTGKLESGVIQGVQAEVAQVYPENESHNLADPQACWCFPDVFVYANEEGTGFDFVTVDHRYVQ